MNDKQATKESARGTRFTARLVLTTVEAVDQELLELSLEEALERLDPYITGFEIASLDIDGG